MPETEAQTQTPASGEQGSQQQPTGQQPAPQATPATVAAQQGAQAGQQAAEQPSQQAPASESWAANWDGKIESLPSRVQEIIREARGEAAQNRTGKTAAEQRMQETVKAFAKAAGIELPGEQEQQPDPTEMAKQLSDSRATARETAAELVVWRNSADLGVDPAAVTDSRAFARATADLDPASETFAEDVKKAAQKAAENNPKLKATRAVGKSSVNHAGGSGEDAITKEQFDAMNGQQRNDLFQRNPTLYRSLAGR